MATSPRTSGPEGPLSEESENFFLAFWKHLQDNPFHYIGSAAFIVAVLVFTFLYRLAAEAKDRQLSAAYVEAVLIEDPVERADALAPLAADKTRLAPYALYMRGEALLTNRDYAAATEAFLQLRETYPDFQFVPDAVEGLGFLQEDQGNTEAALAVYREVLEKWPDTPAGQRQAFNIAQCYERSGDMEQAILFYREQFELFPGSNVSIRAQQRLFALRATHPDLFEDELSSSDAQASEEQKIEPSEQDPSEAGVILEDDPDRTAP